MKHSLYQIALFLCLPLSTSLAADVPSNNPAVMGDRGSSEDSSDYRGTRSWELPAIEVDGRKVSSLREEDRIGSYGQPRWTAHRRFPRSRIYVVPEGKMEFEYWLRLDVPEDGPTKVQNFYEVEFGLPYRFQFDLYVVGRNEGDGGPTYVDQLFELRYALADWGVIPGNPTLYAEYALRDQAADKVEYKLLLGDELTVGWHWGFNAVYEAELEDEKEREYAGTFGISKTIQDEKLSIGVEAEYAWADTAEDRGNFEKSLYVGPSIQVRPLPNTHLNLAPLFGVSDDANPAKILVNFGWEF